MDKKELIFNEDKLVLNVCNYVDNNRLAVLCEYKDGYYSDLTINLPNTILIDPNVAYINSVAKDCGLEKFMIENNIIEEVIATHNYNMEKYDLVRFNFDKLKEYDPTGFESFLKQLDNKEQLSNDIKI